MTDDSRQAHEDLGGRFVHWVRAEAQQNPDGSVVTVEVPAVWTVAHRGYSGMGRLDLWVYPNRDTALAQASEMALEFGLDDHAEHGPAAVAAHRVGDYATVLELYEAMDPTQLMMRVKPAWLQVPEDEHRVTEHPPGSSGAMRAREDLL